MKIKRNIKSFEPDGDVAEMLERAQKSGLEIGQIMNAALKEFGPQIIARLASGRVDSLKSLMVIKPPVPPTSPLLDVATARVKAAKRAAAIRRASKPFLAPEALTLQAA